MVSGPDIEYCVLPSRVQDIDSVRHWEIVLRGVIIEPSAVRVQSFYECEARQECCCQRTDGSPVGAAICFAAGASGVSSGAVRGKVPATSTTRLKPKIQP